MKELKLKKCSVCGRMVEVTDEKEVVMCCGKEMDNVIPNSVECAVEKHIPVYKVVGKKIEVEVPHVMEKDHYIEWVEMVTDDMEIRDEFSYMDIPKSTFDYVPGAKLYAYCNKHGLWVTDVK